MSATGSVAAETWTLRAREVAAGIRRRVLEHTLKHGEGYLSQACSSAEILALLYTHAMRLSPPSDAARPRAFAGVPGPGHAATTGGAFNGERGPDLDRFVLSPAHYALPLYATLIEVGRLHPGALDEYNRDGSTVEMIGAEHSPGFEVTTGSLAQGLSQAVGIALARSLRGESGRVWVLLSDGELEEGQTWETFAAMAFHRIPNLRVVVDANGQQCDGRVASVASIEPLRERVTAFGLEVDEVDGHDVVALDEAFSRGGTRSRVVVARTDPTRGVPLLAERAPLLHTVRISSDEERRRFEDAYRGMVR